MLSETLRAMAARHSRERAVFNIYETIVVIILIILSYSVGNMVGEIQIKNEAIEHGCAVFDKTGQFTWKSIINKQRKEDKK